MFPISMNLMSLCTLLVIHSLLSNDKIILVSSTWWQIFCLTSRFVAVVVLFICYCEFWKSYIIGNHWLISILT